PSRPVHEPVRIPLGAALDRDRVRALGGAVGLGADDSHARSRAALSSAPRLVGAERAADGAVVVGLLAVPRGPRPRLLRVSRGPERAADAGAARVRADAASRGARRARPARRVLPQPPLDL